MKNQNNKAHSSSSSSVHLVGFAPAAAPSTSSASTSAASATGSKAAPPSNDAVTAAASAATATAAGGASDSATTAAAAVAAGSTKKKRGRGDSSALHGKKNSAKKSSQSHYKLSSGETNGNNNSSISSKKNSAMNDNDKDAISADRPLEVGPNFKPLTLQEIQARILALMDRLPTDLPPIPEERMIQFGDVSSEKREFRISNMGVGSSNDDLKIEGGDVSVKTEINGENDNNNNDDNKNNSSYTPQEDHYSTHYPAIHSFASNLQTIVESFNLLLSLVSSATYQWGVDRSGASQQNLAVMSSELQQCQEVISSVVSSRLSNVLCPSVDVLVGKVEIVREGGFVGDEKLGNCHGDGGSNNVLGGSVHDSAKSHMVKKRKLNDDNYNNVNGSSGSNHFNEPTTKHNQSHGQQTKEIRINHYTRPYVDPNYVHLCHVILARNAPMIRHVIASCLHSAQKVIGDYLTAAKKDVNHSDSGRGYTF